MGFGRSNRYARPIDARRRAIAETNAFLTWAMRSNQKLPRIPRRRVELGGFNEMLKRPMAGKIISHWWSKALDRVRDV